MSNRHRGIRLRLAALVLGAGLSHTGGAAPLADLAELLALQPAARTQSMSVQDAAGHIGSATLVDLNPRVGAWLLLELAWDGAAPMHFHLHNPAPRDRAVTLAGGFAAGLRLQGQAPAADCALWSNEELVRAARRPEAFVALCDGQLYLRNRVKGMRTALEAAVDLLRDSVPSGEAIIDGVKATLFADAEREQAALRAAAGAAETARAGPPPALLDPMYEDASIAIGSLGIPLAADATSSPGVGRWRALSDVDGAYVSLIEPRAVAPAILASDRARVNALDRVESTSLVYLVAFDLSRFDLGFALGTEHPRVDWSPRASAAVRPANLPGPDGIGTAAPLVTSGMVPPWLREAAAATFTGGFKRAHGAFRYGPLASVNRGSHYGFIEEGVVLSRLQPGLATLLVGGDGQVEMKTWQAQDDAGVAGLRFARQNGVSLVEWDAAAARAVAGLYVNRWGPGNWSGSADSQLRTTRAGACLLSPPGARFLVYAYFSSATPSAMARVFQAYQCRFGMLLDMNALVHTYLAAYAPVAAGLPRAEHLVAGMAEADPAWKGQRVPRFLVVPDNRDLFYLIRREQAP